MGALLTSVTQEPRLRRDFTDIFITTEAGEREGDESMQWFLELPPRCYTCRLCSLAKANACSHLTLRGWESVILPYGRRRYIFGGQHKCSPHVVLRVK